MLFLEKLSFFVGGRKVDKVDLIEGGFEGVFNFVTVIEQQVEVGKGFLCFLEGFRRI